MIAEIAPQQISEVARTLADSYTPFYRSHKHHSPEKSRVSLMRRMHNEMLKLGPNDWVLDVGSGRQSLERQYHSDYGRPDCNVVTIDIARILKSDLLATRSVGANHVRADGNSLPFGDNTISLVVSNMALDFLGESAIEELDRVVKPGGHVLANLCFSYLNPPKYIFDPQNPEERHRALRREEDNINFWYRFLEQHNILIKDPSEIGPRFSRHGFTAERIEPVDVWWEADMIKPSVAL
jgi:ubiquinone/menaquinone biosynthesis C-methylase UbiE